jgi:hypothetical protein
VLAMVAAACGDDAGNSGEPGTTAPPTTAAAPVTTEASPPAADDPGDRPPSGAVVGSVIVDGTEYSLNQALLCEDDGTLADLGVERELELQGLGSGVQVDLYISTFAGMDLHEVSWFGPEGIFSSSVGLFGDTWVDEEGDTVPEPPISTETGRAVGSLVLYDARGSGDAIEIVFDVAIPDETFNCR